MVTAMADYIEREALWLAFEHELFYDNADKCEIVLPKIDDFPAADVTPVVHGRWVKTQEPLGWHEVECIECSACHDSWIADEDYGLDFADFWKYCPSCGAKMDGDG